MFNVILAISLGHSQGNRRDEKKIECGFCFPVASLSHCQLSAVCTQILTVNWDGLIAYPCVPHPNLKIPKIFLKSTLQLPVMLPKPVPLRGLLQTNVSSGMFSPSNVTFLLLLILSLWVDFNILIIFQHTFPGWSWERRCNLPRNTEHNDVRSVTLHPSLCSHLLLC